MNPERDDQSHDATPQAGGFTNGQDVVVRTQRGLTIRGTRLTLYSIMDYVKAGWSTERIRDWLRLNDEQIAGAIDFINSHRDQVEVEYQHVLRLAEDNRRYWEEYNRNRPKPPPLPDTPARSALRAKIAQMKHKLGME